MIEILGNQYSEFEKNEELVEIESRGIKTFWAWELGLLEQEEQYWEDLLRQLKMTQDQELESMIAREEGCDEERQKSFEKFVQLKYKT